MKKILIGLFVVFLTACSLSMNSEPKAKVKELLDKYKNQDTSVITNLDDVIDSEYEGEYKERFKTLLMNQYKNMEYKITDEQIDGDTAIVTADITIYNYGTAIDSANTYLQEHEKEFYKSATNNNTLTSGENTDNSNENNLISENTTQNNVNEIDYDKFLDYKLNLLEEVTDRKTYSIDFTLTKENDKWVLDELPTDTIRKIHGLYTE